MCHGTFCHLLAIVVQNQNRNLDRPASEQTRRSSENTKQRKHGAACRAACCPERVGGGLAPGPLLLGALSLPHQQRRRCGRPSARAGPAPGSSAGPVAGRPAGCDRPGCPSRAGRGTVPTAATVLAGVAGQKCYLHAHVTAAASPSAFHGQKGRRKKAPAARSGGTDRRSCRWCVITAAGTLRSINDRGCCWPAGCYFKTIPGIEISLDNVTHSGMLRLQIHARTQRRPANPIA